MKTQLLHNICRINGQSGRGIGKTVIAPVDKSGQLVGLSTAGQWEAGIENNACTVAQLVNAARRLSAS
jgi:hypothetical protein